MTFLLRRVTVARPAGYIRMGAEEFDALQCAHCRYTWRYVAGSGRERGWCSQCGGVTCGSPRCMVHSERLERER